MSSLGTRVLTAVVAAVLSLPASGSGQTRASTGKFDKADRSKAGVQAAEVEYRAALEKASAPQQRAASSLDLARFLAASAVEPDKRAEVDRLYNAAIQEASGPLRLEAHNSYGVYLLQQGNAGKAAAVLSGAKEISGDVEPEARSRFLYNYAVALERSGRTQEASEAYQQSFDLDPGFMPACDAVFRTAGPQPRVHAVERLLEAGDFDSARRYLRTSFETGPRESYPDLVVLWVRYLTAAKIGPGEDFRLQPNWLDGLAQERMRLVEQSYQGELPLVVDPEEGRSVTRTWQGSEGSAQAFSDLLRMLGDGFLRDGQAEQALHSYALAWSSAGNLDAAVDLASLLLIAREKVDPQGQVLDRLVSILFEGKGQAYLQEDWPTILRFHTVLGTIFERQGQWGSSGDPRSAVFQWEHALRAQERVQSTEKTLVPGLHAHLGTAYEAVGRKDEALEQFLLAGEQYVKLGWPQTAVAPLKQAEVLAPASGGSEEKERLRLLRNAVIENNPIMEAPQPPQVPDKKIPKPPR